MPHFVQLPSSTPVGNATHVVANVPTCNLHGLLSAHIGWGFERFHICIYEVHVTDAAPDLCLCIPAGAPPVDLEALEASNAALIPLLAADAARVLVDSLIPPDMWAALLPHQQAGVLAGVRRGGRLLLADDMGLGKTAQVRLGPRGVGEWLHMHGSPHCCCLRGACWWFSSAMCS